MGGTRLFVRECERFSSERSTNNPNWDVCSVAFFYDMILYIFLTAIGLTPCGSATVHIYTQTIHRIQITEHT
jgi:hypothetical protein